MKKTFLLLSVATAMMCASCGGGQTAGNNDETDSLSKTEQTDGTTGETNGTTEDANGDADSAENVDINNDLLGEWGNNEDPGITMVLSDKSKNYNGRKGYGYVEASNEYYMTDFILVFKSITPDGKNIKVHYDKIAIDFYEEGEIGADDYVGKTTEQHVGEGDLTIVDIGGNKLKLESSESRLKNKILYKQ